MSSSSPPVLDIDVSSQLHQKLHALAGLLTAMEAAGREIALSVYLNPTMVHLADLASECCGLLERYQADQEGGAA